MKKTILLIFLLCGFFLTRAQNYKYLGTWNPAGVPNYLVEPGDSIPPITLTLLNLALPEQLSVPIYNPQYLTSGYRPEYILSDTADVYVTFVNEGAGFTSALGFYTYNINNPLTKAPPDSAITIVFPNCSLPNSGGNLLPGSKVHLGRFPPNTGIGFCLIANGFQNEGITEGYWKLYTNPDFNPEPDSALRQHTIILNDTVLNHLILSWEDFRRDEGSDNDFNDVQVYVTATPYTSLVQSDYCVLQSANTAVNSAYNGGLESNGNLAGKVALRNFKRVLHTATVPIAAGRNPNGSSPHVGITGGGDSSAVSVSNLAGYFPATGVFGNELPTVSTPTDLVGITNAADVYSVDYTVNNQRVAAGLAIRTDSGVYSHSKSICDRLNSSTLEEVRTITINNYKLLNYTLMDQNANVEYAVAFSVRTSSPTYELYSLWSISEYPPGSYLNFQIWGQTMTEVCDLVYNVLNTLAGQQTITTFPTLTRVPPVFVRSGYYQNGKLHLSISNQPGVSSVTLNANLTQTETTSTSPFSQVIPLNGQADQDVVMNTGALFDAGISLTYAGDPQEDDLYLADGAWGVDGDSTMKNMQFSVAPYTPSINAGILAIERNPLMTGQTSGIVNLFRNAMAGNMTLDISQYSNFSFGIQSNLPVEVVLVSDTLSNWDNRARYELPATPTGVLVNIPLSKFTDQNGNPVQFGSIRTIVFSVKSPNGQSQSFSTSVENANFNKEILSAATMTNQAEVYPNPVKQTAMISVPGNFQTASITVTDAVGRIIYFLSAAQFSGGLYSLNTASLTSGVYFYKIVTDQHQTYKGEFLK